MSPLLEVRNLKVINKKNKKILLKNISFSLEEGEILGILGESGSGKSLTALSILGLLPKELKYDRGEILFEGKDLLKLNPKELQKIRGKKIAIIFQDPLSSFNPVLNIEEQLGEVVTHHLGIKGKEKKELIIKTLQEVGVPDAHLRLKNFPHELSGGLRQRIMIAMSIICSPKILIADEPTTALDLTIQLQILELLKKLNTEKGLSLLFITHDLGVLRWLADRILVYYEGEIMELAPREEIFKNPLHPYTKLLFSSYPGRGEKYENFYKNFTSRENSQCSFYKRCIYSCEKALSALPPMVEAYPGHFVRCFYYG